MSGSAPAAPATRRRPSRRLVRTVMVVAICMAVLAAGIVASARFLGHEPTVTLLANWSGDDEVSFRKSVLAPFEREYHVHVDYQGSSAESQVLSADVETGTPPDVVVLTGPGELAAYAQRKQLKPLGDILSPGDFSEFWAMPLQDKAQDKVYWFPLKADLKSIVWYPGRMSEQESVQAAKQPGNWCLGLGSDATSGWPGTDWIEDILLQQSGPDVYQKWARGLQPWDSGDVRRAWRTWVSLARDDQREDLVRRALTTGYGDASEFVAKNECTLEHQASYIRSRLSWQREDGRYVPSAKLIPGAGTPRGWEVSGDLVALLNDTSPAEDLIRYLASEEAQRTWSTQGKGFTVAAKAQPTSPRSAPAWHHELAATLLDPGTVHCFDASDAMPPSVRDAFTQATIDYFADPGEAHLKALLTNLDKLSGAEGLTWLPAVCDHGT
ncbi:ABC transporter substrate-binding protein [Streptomyces sp. NPDC002520]